MTPNDAPGAEVAAPAPMTRATPVEVRALPALLLGSTAAPAVHVAMGLLLPEGFLDFRGADAASIALEFLGAWLFSASLTVPVGTTFWRVLHLRHADGLVSYGAVALLTAVITSLVFAAALPNLLLIGMALANAALVRLLEKIVAAKAAPAVARP